MHVALTGASGAVGEFVLSALLNRGHSVVALSRQKQTLRDDQPGLTWLCGDIADASIQRSLVVNADALIHSAFSHAPGRYRGGEGDDPAGFWRANFLPTLSLLELAQAANVSRVVMLSSRAVFDSIDPHELDADGRIGDDAATAPNTHYGALKAATEDLCRVYSSQSALSATALRATGVYGVRGNVSSSKWYSLALQARPGNTGLTGDTPGEQIATEVHGDDVASAILLLLEANDERVGGRVFNCSDIALSQKELFSALVALTRGQSIDDYFNDLTPSLWPPRSLRCDDLHNLGWQPGGRRALIETLEQLVLLAGNDVDKLA